MILVNGEPSQCCDSQDRGLHYGHGLFTTLAVLAGQPQLWDYHCRRLLHGAQRLHIALTEADCTVLHQEIQQVGQQQSQAVVKIIITAGVGGRGYALPLPAQPTRMVASYEWPQTPDLAYQQGIVLRICQQRLAAQPSLAGIKHLNRLEQVLARAEWQDAGIDEGLMLDGQDRVIEGITSNVFVVQQGRVLTPDLSQCGVAGVMRQWILDQLAQQGIAVTLTSLSLAQLATAEEVFICNSIRAVLPVRQCNQWVFSAPGEITRRIMAWVADGLKRRS